jgi:hypothetical protein
MIGSINKQILVLLLFLVLTILSIFKLYLYFSNKDFQLRNSENTVFIVMSNGSYLDINPINDVVDDQLTSFVKPFPEHIETTYQKLTKFPFQITHIQQNSAKRKASVEKTGGNQVKVSIQADSNLSVTENHFYYIQLDYSNRFSPIEGDDYIQISDNKCDATIFKESGYKYKIVDDRSIRVGVKYEPKVNITVNLDVDCEQ